MNLIDEKGNLVHKLPSATESKELLKKYLAVIVSTDPSMNDVLDCGIENLDEVYQARNNMVEYCVILAKQCGYKAGFAVHQPIHQLMHTVTEIETHDPVHPDSMTSRVAVKEPEWDARWGVVAYIQLPTGQITWHLDSGDFKWDNHSNYQKRIRVSNFV